MGVTTSVISARENPAYVAWMVTRIHKGTRRRLFLKEHREAKGVSATVMAGRLGIERESVYRIERKANLTYAKQVQWADVLEIDDIDELSRLPSPKPATPSIDAMIRDQPEDVKKIAVDFVQRLVAVARR